MVPALQLSEPDVLNSAMSHLEKQGAMQSLEVFFGISE